jgi:Domain of unknown function (DUF4203)
MDDFLLGLVAILLGLAVCFLGLRLWFIMLPIWGFVAGFFIGAGAFTAIFGDGFLSTASSWVVGFFAGLIFAVLSYLIWYVGAIIAAGSIGALLGSGLMAAIDVDNDWIVFLVSAASAIVVGLIALVIALPVFVVAISTAAAGATAVIGGVMLVFDQIDIEELERGATWAMIEDSWFWIIVWAVLAAIGIAVQLRPIDQMVLPEDKWTRASQVPPPGSVPAT